MIQRLKCFFGFHKIETSYFEKQDEINYTLKKCSLCGKLKTDVETVNVKTERINNPISYFILSSFILLFRNKWRRK